MSVLYIIFPLALVIIAIALTAFIWAMRKGQYDDLDTPALRMLEDDEDLQSGPRT
jgi:cbb3-type cytochrome oxidase maturation protein